MGHQGFVSRGGWGPAKPAAVAQLQGPPRAFTSPSSVLPDGLDLYPPLPCLGVVLPSTHALRIELSLGSLTHGALGDGKRRARRTPREPICSLSGPGYSMCVSLSAHNIGGKSREVQTAGASVLVSSDWRLGRKLTEREAESCSNTDKQAWLPGDCPLRLEVLQS